jgi:hypothetical protein
LDGNLDLTTSGISVTTNSTIAINSSEHFVISYTATSVVLTVASGPASNSNNNTPTIQLAAAATNQPVKKTSSIAAKNNLRHAVGSGFNKGIFVADASRRTATSDLAKIVRPRIWEHIPVTSDHLKAVTVMSRAVNVSAHTNFDQRVNNWSSASHAIPVRAPLTGVTNANNVRRAPMHIQLPQMPVLR